MLRIDFVELHIGRREFHVRHDRVADFGVERRRLDFDILGRADVGADGPGAVRELVEHRGVHVVADAEGEDARAGRVFIDDVFDDLRRVALVDGRLAIGEEDDVERPPGVFAAQVEGRVQGRLDGGAAAGAEVIDPLRGLLKLIRRRVAQGILVGPHGRGETDDAEAIFVAELIQTELQRLLRLRHLEVGHTPRSVEHQHEIARDAVFHRLELRRDEQHEVAVFAADRTVEHGRQADVPFADAVEELEILIERGLVLFELDDGFLLAVALDVDGVRRAVDRLHRILRSDGHRHRELLEGAGALAIGLQRVNVLDDAAVLLADGGEADLHFLIALRRDRENFQSHHAVAEIFEQAGVLRPLDDARVNRAGLLRVEEFAGRFFAVDPHREFVHARPFGDREQVRRFEVAVGVVAERLFDGRDRHLVFDLHIHDVVDHRQRRQFHVVRHQQTAAERSRSQNEEQRGHPEQSTHGDLQERGGRGLPMHYKRRGPALRLQMAGK